MRQFYRTAALGLALGSALVTGCSSERRSEAALARVGDEAPPDFLVGPASLPLKEFDGFSADVVETMPAEIGTRTVSGELIGRQGRLIFQPWTTANIKKGKFVHGGMYFIWDTASQQGDVLSEALQGYAPISAPAQITNATSASTEITSGDVNGHSCHQSELVVGLSDGSSARVTAWRADDLKRFPTRLRVTKEGREVTIDLTNIRLDLAPPELFTPPSGFTQYATSAALINELMIRESTTKKGPSGELGEPIQPPDNGWRGPSTVH